MEILSPAQIFEYSVNVATAKTGRRFLSTVILAFLAGVFIAFGAEGSTMAASGLLSRS